MERGGVMSIFYEKETRNFCVSVVLIILFLFVLETILCIYQKDIIQKIFVSHDNLSRLRYWKMVFLKR